LHVVQWLYARVGDKREKWQWKLEALKGAARNGQMPVIQRLNVLPWQLPVEHLDRGIGEVMVVAAASGQLEVIRWMMERFLMVSEEEALAAAVVAGKGPVEAFLMSTCGEETMERALSSALARLAADNDVEQVGRLIKRCSVGCPRCTVQTMRTKV
jgi:hypothetical protein